MTWRFQKRFQIVPGLRVNVYKRSASISFGHRGFWYTIGTRGRRATIGLPGSGLFYTETRPWERVLFGQGPIAVGQLDRPTCRDRLCFVLLALAALAVILWVLR